MSPPVNPWRRHPHVRTGARLTFGERAADVLKHWFGTWTILGLVLGACVGVMLFLRDPGHLKLNLALSLMAAVQGIILQISANRGDRIASEVEQGTHAATLRIEQKLDALLADREPA